MSLPVFSCAGHLKRQGAVAGIVSILAGCGPHPAGASLTAFPVEVANGEGASLSWNSANATNCLASGGWSGSVPPSGSRPTGALTATTTFTLRCSGSGGTVLRSVRITVKGTEVFPLAHSPNNRYLQDRGGAPFPILGRASWYLVSLPPPEYGSYLDDTLAKGFNSIEMSAITRDSGANRAPFAGNGAVPFTRRLDGNPWHGSLRYANIAREAPDFNTPNPVYWSYLDDLIDYCAARGILVFVFPSYVGYLGMAEAQGYMDEMVANGPDKMRAYGAWVASRYKDRANIVWMLGGDAGTGEKGFNTEQTNVEAALISGLTGVAGQRSLNYAAEWNTESIGTDQADFGQYMNLNGAYSYSGETARYAHNAYAHTPVLPAFLLEEPYDETDASGTRENAAATQPVRRFIWWGMLSSIGGYIAGNGYVWRFNPGYTRHLNTRGATDLSHLNAFMRSIEWWQLVPSGTDKMKTLVRGDTSQPSSQRVAAAATEAGDLLVAYVPPAHTGPVTIDMTAMSGLARASWFNPAAGVLILAGSSLSNGGPHDFSVPGDNGTGYSDWVLLLQSP